MFLGDLGAISVKDAHRVFPILELSLENVTKNEQDWLLEAFYKVFPNLEEAEREMVMKFAGRWQYSSRKSTQQRAQKILRIRYRQIATGTIRRPPTPASGVLTPERLKLRMFVLSPA